MKDIGRILSECKTICFSAHPLPCKTLDLSEVGTGQMVGKACKFISGRGVFPASLTLALVTTFWRRGSHWNSLQWIIFVYQKLSVPGNPGEFLHEADYLDPFHSSLRPGFRKEITFVAPGWWCLADTMTRQGRLSQLVPLLLVAFNVPWCPSGLHLSFKLVKSLMKPLENGVHGCCQQELPPFWVATCPLPPPQSVFKVVEDLIFTVSSHWDFPNAAATIALKLTATSKPQ